MLDPENKRKSIERYVKWGVIALACAISYPIAILAFEGLIMWGAFAGGVLLISNFAPVIATWVANKKIQALVAVIEANPIETMQNLYGEKFEELQSASENMRDFDMELGNFRDQVRDVKSQYPDEAKSYVEIQERMEEALESMKAEHQAATGELKMFKDKIKKAQILFNLAKAANKMLEKSQSAQAAVFAQIKEQVSFDKVRKDLNRAFANLNSAVERRKNTALFSKPAAQLEAAPNVDIIDITKVGQRIKILGPTSKNP